MNVAVAVCVLVGEAGAVMSDICSCAAGTSCLGARMAGTAEAVPTKDVKILAKGRVARATMWKPSVVRGRCCARGAIAGLREEYVVIKCRCMSQRMNPSLRKTLSERDNLELGMGIYLQVTTRLMFYICTLIDASQFR